MKTKSQRYTQTYSYDNTDLNVSHAYIEHRLKYIRPYLRSTHKILELGCGGGFLGEKIQIESKCRVYGADISQSGVRYAKKRGIIAKVADFNNDLPYPDNFFDLVLSDQVLEHIVRTDHLLDEIYRILKPGGMVITITPNLSFWLNRILFVFGFYPLFLEASENTKVYGLKSLKRFIIDKNSMGHVRLFNKAALTDIFENHGYRIVRLCGGALTWNLPSPLKQVYDLTDRFFSLFPSLSRDLFVIAHKPK